MNPRPDARYAHSPVDLVAAAVVTAAIAAALMGNMDGAWTVGGFVLAGWATARWSTWPLLAAIGAVAAGVLVVRAALADPYAGWRGVVGIVTMVAVCAGAGRRHAIGCSRRALLCCLTVSCAAVWACVPETDGARRFGLVVGIAAALAALADAPVAEELLGAALGSLLFVGLAGGQFRASAVVGAVGSFGLIAVGGLVPLVPVPRVRVRLVGLRGPLFVGLHGGAAVVASRVAGLGDGLARSALVLVATLVVLVLAASVVAAAGAGPDVP